MLPPQHSTSLNADSPTPSGTDKPGSPPLLPLPDSFASEGIPPPQHPLKQKKLFCLNPSFIGCLAMGSGFVSGLLTILLGLVFVFDSGARLSWPRGPFLIDQNKPTWRLLLFSFSPDLFVDRWTPIAMGLLSVVLHFQPYQWHYLCRSYLRYFVWLLAVALWGNLGYAGGLGIIVGSFTLVSAFFSFLAIWFCDGPASINFFSQSIPPWKNITTSTNCKPDMSVETTWALDRDTTARGFREQNAKREGTLAGSSDTDPDRMSVLASSNFMVSVPYTGNTPLGYAMGPSI